MRRRYACICVGTRELRPRIATMSDTETVAPAGLAKPKRKGKLHVGAVEELREMIVSGALSPGQKLREQELCERLGISRTPLREALRTLAAQGLVILTQSRGAEVALLSLDDIVALFDVVGTLEWLAARLACVAMSDEAIAEIGMLHYRMLRPQIRGELPDYF